MASTITADNGVSSGRAGINQAADSSGVLALQTTTAGGVATTALSISNTQVVTYTNQPVYSGGTANGVMYLNGSKVVTTGTALTFDGANLGVGTSSTNLSGAGNGRFLTLLGTGATTTAASGRLELANPNTAATGNECGAILFEQVGNNSDVRIASISGTTTGSGGANGFGGYLAFATKGDNVAGAPTEGMRLTSTGLGIGTSSPSYKFQASGGKATTGIVGSLTNVISGGNVKLHFSDEITYNWTVGTTGNSFTISSGETSTIAGTIRAQIDSSGNFGLGVTPSAWYTGGTLKAQQIGALGGISIVQRNSTESYIGQNFYFDSTNSSIRAAAGYSTRMGFYNGSVFWELAGTSSAGSAISYTQAMTLDASGNLGIGTTSPAAKLMVIGTGGASLYIDSSAGGNNIYDATNHIWRSNSGGSERARIDSSGNLGIGTTTLSGYGTNTSKIYQKATGTNPAQIISQSSANDSACAIGHNGTVGIVSSTYGTTGSYTPLAFYTSDVERARIDSSGNLLIGTTTAGAGVGWATRLAVEGQFGAVIKSSGGAAYEALSTWNPANSGTRYQVYFRDGTGAGARGSITTDGTNTAFNTSSDYRLKDNPQPLTGSGAFIDALKPKTWVWKETGVQGVGFIAHEVQEVSPGSVVGEKDGEKMQQMEYGSAEFIANIIAELQSLRARITALEAK